MWVGLGGLSGEEVMATGSEEVQELKGKVKNELPMWSLTSPRMEAQAGAERTMRWVLQISAKPGRQEGEV